MGLDPSVPSILTFVNESAAIWYEPGHSVLPHLQLRREMKNRISIPELSARLGCPSDEALQGLRLWKAFNRLSPSQRSEVLALIEELATDPAPHPDGIGGQFGTN